MNSGCSWCKAAEPLRAAQTASTTSYHRSAVHCPHGAGRGGSPPAPKAVPTSTEVHDSAKAGSRLRKLPISLGGHPHHHFLDEVAEVWGNGPCSGEGTKQDVNHVCNREPLFHVPYPPPDKGFDHPSSGSPQGRPAGQVAGWPWRCRGRP